MQAVLDKDHIEMLLRTHRVGRLACAEGGRPYIVPITYVYEDGCIYGHTNDGEKLSMMRKNPAVCFEVDNVGDFHNWQSAICRGRFEELEGAELTAALELMLARLSPDANEPSSGLEEASRRIKLGTTKGVTYRIRVDEMTGRYEHP